MTRPTCACTASMGRIHFGRRQVRTANATVTSSEAHSSFRPCRCTRQRPFAPEQQTTDSHRCCSNGDSILIFCFSFDGRLLVHTHDDGRFVHVGAMGRRCSDRNATSDASDTATLEFWIYVGISRTCSRLHVTASTAYYSLGTSHVGAFAHRNHLATCQSGMALRYACHTAAPGQSGAAIPPGGEENIWLALACCGELASAQQAVSSCTCHP